jgi:thiosulfate reductase cytochrome b subunit
MPLWNIVLMFVLIVGLIAYQLYRRENEGFTGAIRQKMRPLLRNMRLKKEAMTKRMKRKYDVFEKKYL